MGEVWRTRVMVTDHNMTVTRIRARKSARKLVAKLYSGKLGTRGDLREFQDREMVNLFRVKAHHANSVYASLRLYALADALADVLFCG